MSHAEPALVSSARPRVALVGLGRMGHNHLRVLRESGHFELVAVVDSQARAPGAELMGSAVFLRDLEELSRLDFDCAVVATPTATHADVARRLLEMDRHLLVEKPLASTFQQAAALVDLANARGLRLAVGHVERFNPAVRKLREVIKDGWLGTPIHFSFTRVGGYPETLIAGNNVLLDLAVHDIDVLRGMVGPLKLEASIAHSSVREGVFDTAEIFLSSRAGASATVHTNWITPTKIRTIRVTGSRGVCFVDYILQTCQVVSGRPELLPSLSSGFEELKQNYQATPPVDLDVQREEPLKAQLQRFHRWITDGETGDLCLGADACAAVLIAERAMNRPSVRLGPAETKGPLVPPGFDDVWV